MIFFGAIWAVGSWTYPFGPPLFGVYWLPFFLVSMFLLFFILALPPIRGFEPRVEEPVEADVTPAESKGWGWTALTWIFILAVIGVIIAAAMYEPSSYVAIRP